MGALDLASRKGAEDYFTGLKRPCPSNLCDGFLTEFDVVAENPFKAFLMCPDCESRLRVYRKDT
jgi:hypothetical protein